MNVDRDVWDNAKILKECGFDREAMRYYVTMNKRESDYYRLKSLI